MISGCKHGYPLYSDECSKCNAKRNPAPNQGAELSAERIENARFYLSDHRYSVVEDAWAYVQSLEQQIADLQAENRRLRDALEVAR